MDKNTVIKKYNLSKKQIDLVDSYILKLTKSNQIHNLVGPSTIDVAWDRHINDSLQLSEFILKKNASIIREYLKISCPINQARYKLNSFFLKHKIKINIT